MPWACWPFFLNSIGDMKPSLRKIHWLLAEQFGIDLRRLARSLRGLPAFARDLLRYRQLDAGPMQLQPCLHDRYAQGGMASGEYFLQDLYVARKIHACNPQRHVDIGSRIDGFVAHVASFREVEVIDLRPVHAQIDGIRFHQADLTQLPPGWTASCDSLSCLHALEHFGLGRYGDTLDPEGSRKGLAHMATMLQEGGWFYLSVPIGRARVVFNAHRVLSIDSVLAMAAQSGLRLHAFAMVDAQHGLREHLDPAQVDHTTDALGIFTFRRSSAAP
jgi:hypothetical protein